MLLILTALTILTAAAATSAVKASKSAKTGVVSPPATSVSIDTIVRQVDMNSLPVLDVKEPY
jgi:hypothetical protein